MQSCRERQVRTGQSLRGGIVFQEAKRDCVARLSRKASRFSFIPANMLRTSYREIAGKAAFCAGSRSVAEPFRI